MMMMMRSSKPIDRLTEKAEFLLEPSHRFVNKVSLVHKVDGPLHIHEEVFGPILGIKTTYGLHQILAYSNQTTASNMLYGVNIDMFGLWNELPSPFLATTGLFSFFTNCPLIK